MSFFFLYIFIVMVFWRPQEWLFPGLYGIPILDGVTICAIFAMMMEHDTGKLRMNFKEPQYFLYIGLFFAALMSHISWFYLEGLMNSWQDMFRLTFFGVLLFACCTSVSYLRWIARGFVAMAFLMAIHAILQDTRGYGFAGLRPIMSWRPNVDYLVPRTRFFGIFGDPNDMGQFLATAMPLAFVLFKRSRFVFIGLGGSIVYILFRGFETTLSRGSQVGLLAAVGVATVMLVFRRFHRFVLVLCVLGALAALPFSGRFFGAAWERVDLWGQANWAFMTRPIFGIGRGMITDFTDTGKTVHNAYVACYSEIGVFGFFFWMSLIFLAAIGLLQTRKVLKDVDDPDAQYLYRFSLWGFASLVAFCSSAFFLSRAFVFPLYFLTGMMGAVPFLARAYVPEDREDVHLGLSIRDTCILGIPASLMVILYVYVTIILLNMQR